MAQPIYITDPVVAAEYHVHPAEFASVADPDEAAWLVENHHGYDLAESGMPPAAYYVHPDAPLPFVPYGGTQLPASQPAAMTVTITSSLPGVFDVTFGGPTDAVNATGHFVVKDGGGATLADVTYPQPAGTTRQEAAGLLQAALQPSAATVKTQKNGAILDIRGEGATVVGAVTGGLSIPPAKHAPARILPAAPPTGHAASRKELT